MCISGGFVDRCAGEGATGCPQPVSLDRGSRVEDNPYPGHSATLQSSWGLGPSPCTARRTPVVSTRLAPGPLLPQGATTVSSSGHPGWTSWSVMRGLTAGNRGPIDGRGSLPAPGLHLSLPSKTRGRLLSRRHIPDRPGPPHLRPRPVDPGRGGPALGRAFTPDHPGPPSTLYGDVVLGELDASPRPGGHRGAAHRAVGLSRDDFHAIRARFPPDPDPPLEPIPRRRGLWDIPPSARTRTPSSRLRT